MKFSLFAKGNYLIEQFDARRFIYFSKSLITFPVLFRIQFMTLRTGRLTLYFSDPEKKDMPSLNFAFLAKKREARKATENKAATARSVAS